MRKSIIAGALLLYTACGGGDGPAPGPGPVASVSVTSNASQISVNGTAQGTAVPKDANGTTVTGKTPTWTSLTSSVASVNSSTGVITGVGAGTATIQATVDGVNGTGNIQVIAPVAACSAGVTTVDLPVGGFREIAAGCIKIPAATSAAADYLVIPANTNSIPDVVANYVLKSDEGETVPSNNVIPSNDIFDASSFKSPRALGDAGATQIRFETQLRMAERRNLSIPAAQSAWRGRQVDRPIRYSVSAAIPAVGDRTNYRVPTQNDPCNKFTTITAQVQYINDKVIIYTDVAAPANGFTATDYQVIGDEFSSLIYPTDVSYFGTPLDLDNNSRIIILYTPEVNKLTPSGSSGFVGGFFWAGDLFPVSECPQSNVAEMFYVLAPDPTGTINNNVRSTTSVRQGTRGTIAHEFQHMINASERIRSPISQPFEDVWLDEALAHFAEDAVGRAIRGIGEADDANFNRTLGGNANDFNAFFFQNFARFRTWMRDPGPLAPTSSLADTSLAVRGAAWALLHYTADQYAPGGDIKAFTKKLAGGPDVGIVNLVKAAGNVSWDVLVSGWLAANYADNLGIPASLRSTPTRCTTCEPSRPLLMAQSGVPPASIRSRSIPSPMRPLRFGTTGSLSVRELLLHFEECRRAGANVPVPECRRFNRGELHRRELDFVADAIRAAFEKNHKPTAGALELESLVARAAKSSALELVMLKILFLDRTNFPVGANLEGWFCCAVAHAVRRRVFRR